MDEQDVRAQAQALCESLVAGNIDLAIETFSPELRRNLGEVLGLLPLPISAATVESVEHSGAGYNLVLGLTGDSEEVQVQTRWKDRDGQATMVEASHLSRTIREPILGEGEAPADDQTVSAQ